MKLLLKIFSGVLILVFVIAALLVLRWLVIFAILFLCRMVSKKNSRRSY